MPVPLRSANSRAEAKYNVTTDFPSLGLHGAAASGNIGLVEYALNRGQPINSVLDGVLPLHAACSGGTALHEQVVKRLIEHGADVNAPRLPRRYFNDKSRDSSMPIVGTTGSTPLHFAAANGNTSIVSTLLHYGAQPDRADKHGITPEMLARRNGWLECADLLSTAVRQNRRDAGGVAHTGSALPDEEPGSSSGRRRLHVKRSIDNALTMIKSSSNNLHDMYHSSRSSSNAPQPSPPIISASGSGSREPHSPTALFGDYSFGGSDDPSNHQASSPTRPSLNVPNRLRKTSSTNNPSPSPKRPSSAGNGAEPPSPSHQSRSQFNVPRRPVPKLSFMSLFKKAHDGDTSAAVPGAGTTPPERTTGPMAFTPPASTSAMAIPIGSQSAHSPPTPTHTGLSSSYTEPTNISTHMSGRPAFRYRQGSEGSAVPTRAVDLHNALAQGKHHHHNTRQHHRQQSPSGELFLDEVSGDEDEHEFGEEYYTYGRSPSRSPITSRHRSGSENSEIRCSWRFGSSYDARARSPSRLAGTGEGRPVASILQRTRHHRSTSTGVPSPGVRFDSHSSSGSARAPGSGKLRECSSVGEFQSSSLRDGSRLGHDLPDSAPPAVPDFERNQSDGEDEDEDEEEYGEPISRHSPDLQNYPDGSIPFIRESIVGHPPDDESFPFSINHPPPVMDSAAGRTSLNPGNIARSAQDNRARGDSLSSGASSNVPELFGPTGSADSIATSPTKSPPDSTKLRPSLLEGGSSSGAPSSYNGEAGLGSRRLHTPLDINIQSISSHAQAEALVQKARQCILDEQDDTSNVVYPDGQAPSSMDNIPLSAKLAAFGKSLEVERMFKEKDRLASVGDAGASSPPPPPLPTTADSMDVVTPVSREDGFAARKESLGRQASLAGGQPRKRVRGPRRPNTSEGSEQNINHFAPESTSRPSLSNPRPSLTAPTPQPASISPHTDSSSSPHTPAPAFNGTPSSYYSYHRSRVRSMDDEGDSDYEHPIVRSHTPVDFSGGSELCRVFTAPTPNYARSADKLSRMGFSREMVEAPGRMVALGESVGTPPQGKKFGLRSLFKSSK